MSIDNITVQEWNKMGYKTVDDEDNEPNHHPRFSEEAMSKVYDSVTSCLLYTSPSPRDGLLSRMPSSA